MGSYHTKVQINNKTDLKIKLGISGICNKHWDGGSRPDHNLKGLTIPKRSFTERREEINSCGPNALYTVDCTFIHNQKLLTKLKLEFRINQKKALDKSVWNHHGHVDPVVKVQNHTQGIITFNAYREDCGSSKGRIIIDLEQDDELLSIYLSNNFDIPKALGNVNGLLNENSNEFDPDKSKDKIDDIEKKYGKIMDSTNKKFFESLKNKQNRIEEKMANQWKKLKELEKKQAQQMKEQEDQHQKNEKLRQAISDKNEEARNTQYAGRESDRDTQYTGRESDRDTQYEVAQFV
jgi:hypothetical protein